MSNIKQVEPSKSLTDLCKSIGGVLPEGQRIYKVSGFDGNLNEWHFVLSNSPAQAAMTVMTVERLSDKEITKAAFEALAELAKGTK